MADERPTLTDDQIDTILRATGAQLDLPPMADAAARARARIELRSNWGRQGEGRSVVVPFPVESADTPAPPSLPVESIDRERGSRLREFALLTAGLAAAAVLVVVLTLVFRGFDNDEPGEYATGPLAAEPYEIPGFEFAGAFGQPMVPNEPVDVAVGPDGTLFVLDAALKRVITFDRDGKIKTAWGNEGFSWRIPGATSLGAGPTGEVYVVADQVYVLNSDGEESDAWPIPAPSEAETGSDAWDQFTQRAALDSMGNVYVAKRATIWKFEPGGGSAVAIEPDMGEGIHVQIDSQDRLYAMSIEGEIRRVNPDGTSEVVVPLSSRLSIAGFAIAPDDSIIVFRPDSGTGDRSTFLRLDGQGNELARWEMDRAGAFRGGAGPSVFVGIAVAADGTVILPDPMAHRVAFYDAGGSFIREIKDSTPEAFGRLWRIAVDGIGNVLGYDPSVVDAKVLKFSPGGELLQSVQLHENALRQMSTLYYSGGFAATAEGGFIIAEGHQSRIFRYSPGGELVEEWGAMDPDSQSGILGPHAIVADGQGFLYIVDEGFDSTASGTLRKFTIDGEYVDEVGSITSPSRADIAYHDGAIWVVDEGGIVRYPADGGEPQTIATPNVGDLDGILPGIALTLALDNDGDIYCYLLGVGAEDATFTGMLAKLDPQGNLIWTAELADDAGSRYVDLAIAPDGTLYLADSDLRQILAYRPTDDSQEVATAVPTATAEPEPAYVPEGDVPDLLVVERVGDASGPPQLGIYDPASGELVDLPAGELVGISPDGGTLLLIDREPGEEWLRLDLIAVSAETFEELWRTDVGERAESRPNTIYFDTAITRETVYVAIHDPDYRGEMLEIAQVRLSDGYMAWFSAIGMDTDVGELTDPTVEVELLPSPPNNTPKVTSLIRAPDENRTTIQSVQGPGYDHRLIELVPLEPGERYLLPGGEGLFNIPPSGFTTDPAIEYVMFEDVSTGRIELPFDSIQTGEGAVVEYALSHDGRKVYALSPYDAQIAMVDLESLNVVMFESLLDETPPSGQALLSDLEDASMFYARHPMALSPDGRYLYALGTLYPLTGGYTPGIWKIDTSNWTIVDESTPGGSWSTLSIHGNNDGSELYVSLGLGGQPTDGENASDVPGMSIVDTETMDDRSGLVDLEGHVIIGTLADLYREFHGRSPAVDGVAPQ